MQTNWTVKEKEILMAGVKYCKSLRTLRLVMVGSKAARLRYQQEWDTETASMSDINNSLEQREEGIVGKIADELGKSWQEVNQFFCENL